MSAVKTRATHIEELFDALPLVEGFKYSTEQLWEFFEAAVKDKDIKLRKLTRKKDGSNAPKAPRSVSAYNCFMKHFNKEMAPKPPEDCPDKKKFIMGALKSAWNEVKANPSELKKWEDEALSVNTANGIQKKVVPVKKPSYSAQLKSWNSYCDKIMNAESAEEILSIKALQKEEFPDGKPVKPPSKKNTPQVSDTEESPKANPSIDEIAEKMELLQVQQTQDMIDEAIADKLKQMNEDDDSDSDSDDSDDPDDDEEDDEEDEEDALVGDAAQVKWLKTLGFKSNIKADFKAWIMCNQCDVYGPDLQNTIPSSVLKNEMEEHDYDTLKNSTDAPWHNFVLLKKLK